MLLTRLKYKVWCNPANVMHTAYPYPVGNVDTAFLDEVQQQKMFLILVMIVVLLTSIPMPIAFGHLLTATHAGGNNGRAATVSFAQKQAAVEEVPLKQVFLPTILQ